MSLDRCKVTGEIKSLAFDHMYYFNIVNDGGAACCRTSLGYDLFEIPLYGGNELFVRFFNNDEIEDMLDLAYSWT